MDDIYDNLDNYNETNVIEELRTENKDLKVKLEEYSFAMEKLRKNILQDFDKLASEYKKLEVNYSSLLKTARAEVERKTQIITRINLEKDVMVLNAIQNRNITRNSFGSIATNNTSQRSSTMANIYNKKTAELTKSSKSRSSSAGRKEESRTPSTDTISSFNTENINLKSVNEERLKPGKIDGTNNMRDIKENVIHSYKQIDDNSYQKRPSSIKNRRKSMPVTSLQCKFSSDEEFEDSRSKKEFTSKDSSWKAHDRKFAKTASEFDTYHNRKHRQQDSNDKNRNRDYYEYPQKQKSHYSPERISRRSRKDYQEEKYRQDDKYRHMDRPRVLESPLRDEFHRQDSQDHRYRSSNYCESERHRYSYYQGRPGMKHKYANDHDGPPNKRSRTEEQRGYNEEGSRWDRHKESNMIQSITETVQDIEHMSCQSPDYILVDQATSHTIREIKHTAVTQLDDPREHSKRYIIKNESGKKVLTTVIGRNVDLKPVDKSLWKIQKIDIPQALKTHPSKYTEDIINEIYMDVENPVAVSASGQMPTLDPQEIIQNFDDTPKVLDNINIKKTAQQNNMEQSNTKVSEMTVLNKYKIPKKLVSDSTPLSEINIINDVQAQKQVNDAENPDVDKCYGKIDGESLIEAKKDQVPRGISREMVEGDLELSDETNDYSDIQRHILKENLLENDIRSDVVINTVVGEIKTNDSLMNQQKFMHDSKENPTKNDVLCTDDSGQQPLSELKSNSDSKDGSKKSKTKKKSQKQKTSKEPLENPQEDVKTTRSKNNEIVTKDVKSKFCDLFGESSSLITPEDLGLGVPQQLDAASTKYVPIFEDAQDAIDIVSKNIDVQTHLDQNDIKNAEKSQNTNDIDYNLKSAKSLDTNVQTHSALISTKLAEDLQNTNDHIARRPKSAKSSDTKKKKSKKREDENISYSKSVTTENISICKEVITPENFEKADVVKSVIISTGVQPEYILDNTGTTDPSIGEIKIPKLNTDQNKKSEVERNNKTMFQALATSTPAKESQIKDMQPDKDSKVSDNSNNSNVRVVQNNPPDQTPPTLDQTSDSNTLDTQTDTDAPDVRIFVRRRRKVIKRTT